MSSFQPNNSNVFGQQNQQQQGTPFNTPFGQQPAASPFNAPGTNAPFNTPAPGANTAFNAGAAAPFGSAGAQAFGGFAPFGASGTPSQQGGIFSTGSSPFGQAPNAAPANPAPGQAGTSSSPFGQPAGAAAPQFGQASNGPFGQTGAANTPFGQNNPFGQNASAPGAAPMQGIGNSTVFNPSAASSFQPAQQAGQSGAFSFVTEPSVFATQGCTETTEPSVFSANAPSAFAAGGNETTIDQSCLMSSIKDSSVNLYNLTLQEIIDMQASTLDRNIKEFRRDAQAVFEQDMQLIRAKNHYVELQKSIEHENLRMDELSELIDYLERHLDSLPVGDETEVGQCVGEFERIVDRFYDKVQRTKDEQGEVLNILNENYELIEAIDKKLDSLEDFAILK